MNRFFFLVLLLGTSLGLAAQPLNKSTLATKIKLANQAVEEYNYYHAIDQYEQAYEEAKDYDIAIKIAELNLELRDYKGAARWYTKALRRDKEQKYDAYRFNYARALKMNGDYVEAVEQFEAYLKVGKDETKKRRAEIEILGAEMAREAQDVDGLTFGNAGRKVNSSNSEYSPHLEPGNQSMYYAGPNNNEIMSPEVADAAEFIRILQAKKGERGWEKPTELDDKINRPGFHTANPALSADGSTLLFTRSTLEANKLLTSKIYYATQTAEGWSAANEVAGVNGEYIATHPAFGELYGNSVMFFSANMDGGEGGYDLYYATRKSDGVYGDPVNLGPGINTIGDEKTPHYRDGVLYFSSNGLPSMGGLDIFSSEWDGAKWSRPANMGKGYNSSADDQYFMIDNEGYTGVFTSNREGGRSVKSRTCCDDVYNFSLKEITADLIVTVLDAETGQPLNGALIQLVEMLNDTPGETTNRNAAETNTANFPLALDRPYMIIAQVDNYRPDTTTFNTVGLLDNRTFNESLSLEPLPKTVTISREEPIELGNIYYDFNKADIRPEAEPDLQFLYDLLQQYPNMVIELGSHTDARGRDAYNRTLAQSRAESARRWLTNKGVARRRVVAKGYGEDQPKTVTADSAADNPFLSEGTVLTEDFINALPTEEQQEAAHQLNRRTEFKILEGPTSIVIEETKLIQIGNRKVDESSTPAAPDRQRQPAAEQDSLRFHPYSSLYQSGETNVPVMRFDERLLHLGPVKRGEKAEATFQFRNAGTLPLTIELVSACDCTTLDYDARTYQPGETGTIHITFDSTEKEESETIDVDVFLKETNSKDYPIIETVKYDYELVK